MNTITHAPQSTPTPTRTWTVTVSTIFNAPRPRRLLVLAWPVMVCGSGMLCETAQAIDYAISGSSGEYDATGHGTVDSSVFSESATVGTLSVRFEFCAGKQQSGEDGCCCSDNCSTCDAPIGLQDCEPDDCASPCTTCCHATVGGECIGGTTPGASCTTDADCGGGGLCGGEAHQSCCSQDGPPGDICCGGWSPCTVAMRRVRICTRGSQCNDPSYVKVVLCDNTDVDTTNDCPAAGARLDRTLTVNTAPLPVAGVDELTQDELCEIHNCLTDVFIEFEEEVAQAGETLSARIIRYNLKSPLASTVAGLLCPKKGTDGCVDVPTVSEWGVVTLTMLILTAGAIVILRRRYSSYPAAS